MLDKRTRSYYPSRLFTFTYLEKNFIMIYEKRTDTTRYDNEPKLHNGATIELDYRGYLLSFMKSFRKCSRNRCKRSINNNQVLAWYNKTHTHIDIRKCWDKIFESCQWTCESVIKVEKVTRRSTISIGSDIERNTVTFIRPSANIVKLAGETYNISFYSVVGQCAMIGVDIQM